MSKSESSKFYLAFSGPDFNCYLCWIFRKFLRDIFGGALKTIANLHTVTYFAVHDVKYIFLQIKGFQNSCL